MSDSDYDSGQDTSTSKGLELHFGLQDHDHCIDYLSRLFEMLKPYSAEILASGVDDFLSFALHQNTLSLGIITIPTDKDYKEPKPSKDPMKTKKGRSKQRAPPDSAYLQYRREAAAARQEEPSNSNDPDPGTSPLTIKKKRGKGKKSEPSMDLTSWGLSSSEIRSISETRTVSEPETRTLPKCIGFVYFTTGDESMRDPHAPGELSLGIVIHPDHRRRGHARQALDLALKWAFEDLQVHRVQALICDKGSPCRDRIMVLLTQACFNYEGTRRLAFKSPLDNEWKDVEYLSILDTEFLMRNYFTPAPKSLWDEMLARHQREREELLRWEEKHHRISAPKTLRRVESVETITGASEASEEDSSECVMDTGTPATRGSPLFDPVDDGSTVFIRECSTSTDGGTDSLFGLSSPLAVPSSPAASQESWDMISNASSLSSFGSSSDHSFPPDSGSSSRGTPSVSSGYESDHIVWSSSAER